MEKLRTGLLIIVVAVMAACNTHNNAKADEKADAPKPAITVKVADLATNMDNVCGMKLEDGHIGDTTTYQGKIYGFCSSECKAEFLKDPQSHLTQK